MVSPLKPNHPAGTLGSCTRNHTQRLPFSPTLCIHFSIGSNGLRVLHIILNEGFFSSAYTCLNLTPLSYSKNHLWQVLPCGLSKDSWGMPKKYSESRTSSWAVSCFPTLTYSSSPYTHPVPSLLFTLSLFHKYCTVSFSYWKENHNFKTGFEPHTQPQRLLKLCGTTLFFAVPGWEEAILWTACSVEGRQDNILLC